MRQLTLDIFTVIYFLTVRLSSCWSVKERVSPLKQSVLLHINYCVHIYRHKALQLTEFYAL